MGCGSSKVPNDLNYAKSIIDGRYGEIEKVYIGKNDFADFVFDHRFIFVDVEECDHYKIYEWTKSGLKMFASRLYPIKEEVYIGASYVRVVYRLAKDISEGKSFSLVSFNCKDWVEKFYEKFGTYKVLDFVAINLEKIFKGILNN